MVILKEALRKRDFSDETLTLARAAKIVWQDIFSHRGFSFSGTFPRECQETSGSASLKTLVSMVLNRVNLKEQQHIESQPCLTISPTLVFNSKKHSQQVLSAIPERVSHHCQFILVSISIH